MDETDAFFTQTIVGAPFSVLLGRQLEEGHRNAHGIEMSLYSGESQLSHGWKDWMVLSHNIDASGQPRRRPGSVRRWLERHALWLALLGMLNLIASAVFWGFTVWN